MMLQPLTSSYLPQLAKSPLGLAISAGQHVKLVQVSPEHLSPPRRRAKAWPNQPLNHECKLEGWDRWGADGHHTKDKLSRASRDTYNEHGRRWLTSVDQKNIANWLQHPHLQDTHTIYTGMIYTQPVLHFEVSPSCTSSFRLNAPPVTNSVKALAYIQN